MVSSVRVKHNPRRAKGGCHVLSNWGGRGGGGVVPCGDMQKIILHKVRFDSHEVKLNIKKLRKLVFWNFIRFFSFLVVNFNLR